MTPIALLPFLLSGTFSVGVYCYEWNVHAIVFTSNSSSTMLVNHPHIPFSQQTIHTQIHTTVNTQTTEPAP